jgi:dTMP kinase
MRRGLFITFEGIEGVGKSTQLRLAADHLAGLGREVVVTREPGGTPLAERIRWLVLDPDGEPVPPNAELCLMFAARAVHTENLIKPALDRGACVLCDRYTDATHAYQGGGRGVSSSDITLLADLGGLGLTPDLTILLDAEVPAALERVRQRGGRSDRFEQEALPFFERVRECYLTRAAAEPARVRVVEAIRPIDVVAAEIRAILATRGLA